MRQKLNFRSLLLNMCQEQFEHRPEPSEADADEESELRKKRRTLGECHAAHTKHTHTRER
jgi:hypothetical protein